MSGRPMSEAEMAQFLMQGSAPARASSQQSQYEDDLDSLAAQFVNSNGNLLQQPARAQPQPFPMQSITSSFDPSQFRNYQRPVTTQQPNAAAIRQQIQQKLRESTILNAAMEPFPQADRSKIFSILVAQKEQKLGKEQVIEMLTKAIGSDSATRFVAKLQSAQAAQAQLAQQQRQQVPNRTQQAIPIQVQQAQIEQQPPAKKARQQKVKSKSPEPEAEPEEIDSSQIQDVMQYAGVDLKAETALLNRQKKTYAKMSKSKKKEQQTSNLDMLSVLKRVSLIYGFKKLDSECGKLLTLALERYLENILTCAIRASLARVESGRDEHTLSVDEQEQPMPAVKKALMWLEKHDRQRDAQLALQLGGGVSEEGYQAWIESEASKKQNEGNGMDMDEPKNEQKERVDLAVTARLTNNAAMQAAGLSTQKYSWMYTGASGQAKTTKASTQQPQQNVLPKVSIRQKVLKARRVEIQDLEYAIMYAIRGRTLKRNILSFERGVQH